MMKENSGVVKHFWCAQRIEIVLSWTLTTEAKWHWNTFLGRDIVLAVKWLCVTLTYMEESVHIACLVFPVYIIQFYYPIGLLIAGWIYLFILLLDLSLGLCNNLKDKSQTVKNWC